MSVLNREKLLNMTGKYDVKEVKLGNRDSVFVK